MWFEKLTGFKEESLSHIRQNIVIKGNTLISKINDKSYVFGELEIPSLEELRNQYNFKERIWSRIKVKEVVGDVQAFHQLKENNGAFFQAASQFNLLEMTGPNRTPEEGVGIYEHDRTQGPACAIACGAGTIYRNNFAEVNGQIGQTVNNQIDCLKDIGAIFENENKNHWKMSNGYALATKEGLEFINRKLESLSKQDYELLKGKLRIGIQRDTEVTLNNSNNTVSQAYCSALPVAYSNVESKLWEPFARLILEATYEATFYAAIKNFQKTGNKRVFLTLVGGGAFGNNYEWILDAIRYSIKKFSKTPLDIRIVSYGGSDYFVEQLIKSL